MAKHLVFKDSDEGAELFVWVWIAYANSQLTTSDDEELRRAEKLRDMRDAISKESVVRATGEVGRILIRGGGDQVMELTNAEYDLLKRAVKSFRWPLINAATGRMVREFIDNVETVDD